MNVIVANEQQEQLSNLDIDIIKNITGVYDVSEIVEMFKNFFYSKMILDVTALKDYSDFRIYEKLIQNTCCVRLARLGWLYDNSVYTRRSYRW